jgi:hypothetical protein
MMNSIFFIFKPLLSKWKLISFICILPVLQPAFAQTVDFNKINELHSKQLQTQVQEVIKKVDEAIYSIIKLPDRERIRFATLITLSCKKYNIDPRIMIAILKVESDFNQSSRNTYSCKFKRESDKNKCGDHSVAQINYHIWVKRFRALDKAPLHFEKLKEDDAYAIFRMGEILAELQKQHSKNDNFWFARYHSATPKFKNAYIKKLQVHLKKLLPYGPNMLEKLPKYESIIALN